MSALSPHQVGELLERHSIDVLLLGFPKAGTTHLAQWLGESPGCEVSDPKETFLLCPEFGRRVSRTDPFSGPDDLLRIEATTLNVYSPAVRAAMEQNPTRKAILLVREPWECVVSWHNQARLAGVVGDVALGEVWAASTGTSPVDERFVTDYRQMFDFGTHIAAWRAAIGDERLLVVFNSELGVGEQPWIERFLGIGLGAEPTGRANSLHSARFPGLYSKVRNTAWIRHAFAGSGPLRAVTGPVTAAAKRVLTRAETKDPASEEIREALAPAWQDALVEAEANRRYWRSR
ncbi:MAG: hypothetical protein ACE367_18475 [Acidimicrobiales bacterium]